MPSGSKLVANPRKPLFQAHNGYTRRGHKFSLFEREGNLILTDFEPGKNHRQVIKQDVGCLVMEMGSDIALIFSRISPFWRALRGSNQSRKKSLKTVYIRRN